MAKEQTPGLDALEARLRAILPGEYQDSYEDIQPVPMGSAGLKYGSDGKVAWDDMWESFCDLAMAGGPPHKGALLKPGSETEIDAQADRYREVVDEICRGITMVTGLDASRSPIAGWVRVDCETEGMAAWLLRAIVMENVSVHRDGAVINLPAGPGYRLEKEIKNVITVIAKTCHYWLDHMWLTQQREIASLFETMETESPMVQPSQASPDLAGKMAAAIQQQTGLRCAEHADAGWLGVECPDVHSAIWMMRALVVSNVLSRREGMILFVPVNSLVDPDGEIVVQSLIRIHGFARARGVFILS